MAKVTQNAFGISLKKKKMKITVQCQRNTQQTRAGKHSHCLLKISKKKKKKNQLVSRDPNVTSHCPTNTIQKVPNFSTFMRPHSILQCLVSVVKSAHIYKHVRQQFIYLTWKQLAFSPPQFHLTLAFFFFSCNATSNSWWWSENHESHSLQKALDSHQCAQYKTPDSPLHKSGGRFGTQVNLNNHHNEGSVLPCTRKNDRQQCPKSGGLNSRTIKYIRIATGRLHKA